jgi:2-polyprenyl-3-methyl-5-hydroxy-6-metoxy-1,4-benzoquinol methylase/GNAT superfamily N-acetyltransferase
MNAGIEFFRNRAGEQEIAKHLLLCDDHFKPRLSSRVEVADYAHKLSVKAMRFEAWVDGSLVGLVAVYCNDNRRRLAYVTSVSVVPESQGRHIASNLMDRCIQYLRIGRFDRVDLEVDGGNHKAILMYEKQGFIASCRSEHGIVMRMSLGVNRMINQRDYDAELKDTPGHNYAYEFDIGVMHSYMMRSFEPFFSPGSCLELGSFKGDFTTRLVGRFHDVTCVDASAAAIEEAKNKLGETVTFIHSTLEALSLSRPYDNVFLTHILEHLDEPVAILKRINDQWLSQRGRLFLVCPNANAPSRQIAVKMGLISHNSAVTPAEAEHGHRRTYSLDTLERDAAAAGLRVIFRSGIFFKALANFQWDRLLKTDIVTQEYLDGCYKLGQLYPDLCSSIFLMCEQGERTQCGSFS